MRYKDSTVYRRSGIEEKEGEPYTQYEDIEILGRMIKGEIFVPYADSLFQ